ncbi:FHA domain-containing protein [Scytonema sp. PRP1]
MCGTPLGNVVPPPSAENQTPSAEKQLAEAVPSAKFPASSPAYQAPAPSQPTPSPPAYQASAPLQPALSPPAYQASAPSSLAHTPAPHLSAQPTLKLIHTSGKEFRLHGEEGYIGRQSAGNHGLPEIDLSGIPNEGIVSRSHARVYWDKSQNAYMLVDNNSRNGTYLNEKFLSPGIHYRLNHKDSLQLGQERLVCFTVSLTDS